jgi:hypothetical protein
MSEYNEIKASGFKRGRKPLPPEEKARRVEIQKKRQEARRRALAVLQHRHAEEFAQICEAEFKALNS